MGGSILLRARRVVSELWKGLLMKVLMLCRVKTLKSWRRTCDLVIQWSLVSSMSYFWQLCRCHDLVALIDFSAVSSTRKPYHKADRCDNEDQFDQSLRRSVCLKCWNDGIRYTSIPPWTTRKDSFQIRSWNSNELHYWVPGAIPGECAPLPINTAVPTACGAWSNPRPFTVN